VCNATLPDYNPIVGAQLAPRFQISYGECTAAQCTDLSDFGSGTTYVSAQFPFKIVRVLTFPSGGTVEVNGARYSDGSRLDWIENVQYQIAASPAQSSSDLAFAGWITSGGMRASNATASQTTAEANASGTLEADFVCYSLGLSSTTGGGTESAAPISTGNCPSSDYLPGTSVAISAVPEPTWSFQSWTGTGTVSYSGTNPTAKVTMNSNIIETAGYATATT
jgi:hypothetical protein